MIKPENTPGFSTRLALLSAAALLLVAGPAPAQNTGAMQPFDCLLVPYEVVEISSAVQGVIDEIHVDRNDTVARGQLLVQLDSEVERTQVDLARTRAALRTSIELRETELAFSQRNQKRMEQLYKKDTVSLHTKDEAETDTSKSRLQLRNARDSQRLAELELAKAEAVLALRSMHSPIDGVVVARNKVAGEFVEDQSILRLARLDPLTVEVIVPVEMFGSIEQGMQVEVMPEHYGKSARMATVTMVDRTVDPASGTFDVRAELPNPEHSIPSGLRCTAQFLDKPVPAATTANVADMEGESSAAEIANAAGMEGDSNAAAPEPEFAPVPALSPVAECTDTRQSVVENYAVLANPADNASSSSELLTQLKARGIDDLYLMHSGVNRGRVQLGLYRQKTNAEQRLADLTALGFRVELDTRAEAVEESACVTGQQFAVTAY